MSRSLANDEYRRQLQVFVEDFARWTIYGTFTFRYPVSEQTAWRSYERFLLKNLAGVGYFYACERNDHGWHIHALWSSADCVFRKEIFRRWYARHGVNRIVPIPQNAKSSFNLSRYLAKYVTKDTGWWNIRSGDAMLRLTQVSSSKAGLALGMVQRPKARPGSTSSEYLSGA